MKAFHTLVILVCAVLTAEAAPVMEGKTERPLRYRPDGTDFVIKNGPEFFNRPLYGSNTAFRADGGDKPEFSLYLPGRGGNLRLGLKSGDQSKWLIDARNIVTRYRPGSLIYEIRDPLIGTGSLTLTVQGLALGDGMIVRADLAGNESPVALIAAFGGMNGEKGKRSGDIGAERVPVKEFFQLMPEYCRDNQIEISGSTFVLKAKPATIAGTIWPESKLALADATKWNDLGALLAASGPQTELPVVVAETPISAGKPVYVSLRRIAAADQAPQDPAADFETAEKRRGEMAGKLIVETPDPFINAAATALCVASDGVWDEPSGAFMHGAVAWRNKLLVVSNVQTAG